MYDAIIIGARCAGAATAFLLARRGHKVLLLDRATFPSDVPQGHFIHRGGTTWLAKWGLLDRILETCPAVDHVISDFGDFPLESANLSVNGVPFGCGPRRRVLDRILIDAAVEAGAEFRPATAVDEYLTEGNAIRGIRTRDGHSENARITVGADGRNSALARFVDAPVYEAVPPLMCYYFSYWSGFPHRGLELYLRPPVASFGHPTNEGLFAIFCGWPVERFTEIKSDVERHFRAAVAATPLGDRLEAGRREERFYGTADLPNFFRKPFGAGWALVGDAGHHKDPFLALGMRDALTHAELLADAIHDGLSGARDLQAALADYQRVRDETAMPLYRLNLYLAAFQPPPPDLLQHRAAVRHDPEGSRRFWLVDQGMIASGIAGGTA